MIIINNPPYSKTGIHRKIANLFNKKYKCVFVMPITLYAHIENDSLPNVCNLVDTKKYFAGGCRSVSNICIVGYNIGHKDHCAIVHVLEKNKKYFTESIASHFNGNGKYKLYLKSCYSAFGKAGISYVHQEQHQEHSPFIAFFDKEEMKLWAGLYKYSWLTVLFANLGHSPFRVQYDKLQWFPPGTTLDDVKAFFHLTDDEIKALEAYK